ncbi:MAG: hypothetical protein AB7P69_05640 [Candidatus Binatia bacterium]
MKFTNSMIAILTIVFLLTTSQLTHADDSALTQYFPLSTGNRWVYEVQDRRDDAPPTEEYWEVIREEQGAYVLRIRLSDLTTGGFEEYFIPTSNGVKRFARETKDKDHPPFFLKGPVRVGTTWEDDEGAYEITAVDRNVTVPAGTFSHCLEVTNRRNGGKATVLTLYAPDVGVVQREETFPIIEGSGSFYPQRQDKAVMRLREWKLSAIISMRPLSLSVRSRSSRRIYEFASLAESTYRIFL